MVQIQYSGIFFIVYILHLASFPVGFAGSTKVILLTTEGATTDLRWKVENWNDIPGYPGWEDMSMPYKDQVLRGYQICEINHVYNKALKPETWLLLPKVNINGTSRVYIEMNFTMRECRDLQKTCRETFSVYYRTSKEWDDVIKFHPKQFKKIDTVAAEVRFSPNINDTRMNHETVDISFENASRNFNRYLHIAIVDAGACVALMGIRIYHKVCRETVAGFATFAETKTGMSDTSLVPIAGTCVAHSVYRDSALPANANDVSINSSGPLYHCTSAGEWQVNTGMCECIAGYEPNDNQFQCIPCKRGMYKPSIGNKLCMHCPTNSGTMVHGAISCHCDAGYSAIKDHKFGSPSNYCQQCSRLPGPPQRLDISFADSDNPGNLKLSWRRPVDNGGCVKVRYYLFCSHTSFLSTVDTANEDDKSCSHVEFSPSSREVNGLKVFAKNLRGHSSYNFTVMAYTPSTTSGMSDKLSGTLFDENTKGDSNRTNQVYSSWQNQELSNLLYHSSAHILHQTSDTLPTSVEDLAITMENETAIVVSWKRPAFPNGNILFYSVWYSLDHEASLSLPLTSNVSEMNHITFSGQSWMNMQTNNTDVILTGLSPGSDYQIIVTVHNSAGSDNGSIPLLATTLPLTERPPDYPEDPNTFPYIIATIVVAGLIVLVCVVLLLQWKCRSDEKKGDNGNGEAPTQFRPYNSQHDTLDQRTYVDPFCLDSLPNHQFLCETSPESITIGEVIGCGEFGEVYKGTLATIDLKTGQETTIGVAVKCLKNQCKPEEQKSFFQEARSLEKFRHPNVVHLEAVVTLTRPFIIVTELMANGSLLGFLTNLKAKSEAEQGGQAVKSPISYQTLVKMLRGVASGMEYLSGRGYVHRDLAARNVLVNSDMICKVADFGLLREFDNNDLDHGQGTYTTSGGKIAIKWTAPEAIAFRTFTQFSDVWSFGILMWEAASYGEKPYWAHTNDEVIKAVNQGLRLPAPNGCPSVLHELMLKCWQRDHNSRPTFTKIISELARMLSNPTVLDLPASPASCGHPEMFFDDEANAIVDELEVPQDTDNLLTHEEDTLEQPVPVVGNLGIDLHDLLSDSENELSDSDEGTIGSDTPDEDGSEVSSCTSTICASEITVCAGDGSATYVPLLRSEFDSDEDQSSRSCTPTGHYYSIQR